MTVWLYAVWKLHFGGFLRPTVDSKSLSRIAAGSSSSSSSYDRVLKYQNWFRIPARSDTISLIQHPLLKSSWLRFDIYIYLLTTESLNLFNRLLFELIILSKEVACPGHRLTEFERLIFVMLWVKLLLQTGEYLSRTLSDLNGVRQDTTTNFHIQITISPVRSCSVPYSIHRLCWASGQTVAAC